MELLYSILSTVHIFVCILLIVMILLQKGTGDGLFTSGSSGNPFMSGIEVASFLSSSTKYLGIFFLVNTLFLASLSVKISKQNKVIIEDVKQEKRQVPLG